MRLLLIAILVGVAWGYGSGGRLQALAGVSLRAPLLLPAALGLQLALGLQPLGTVPAGGRFTVVLGSYVLIGVWLVVNARVGPRCLRPTLGLFAAGWLMNLAVMVPNGGMPVSPSALEQIGVSATAHVEEGYLSKHVTASSSSALLILGDIIPAAALRSVLSVGDLVMALGLSLAVARGMRPETGVPAGQPTRCVPATPRTVWFRCPGLYHRQRPVARTLDRAQVVPRQRFRRRLQPRNRVGSRLGRSAMSDDAHQQ